MKSGGQILADGLVALGARCGFGVPGESYLALLDGFYQLGNRFQLFTCRHEGGASYMAEAYGKISGTPGLCFVTRGPGASNAMIGVHTAYQDSTPMLLFIGQVERGHSGREAFQELSYSSVYGSVAKAVMRIDSAARVSEILSSAWALSLSGRPGPVVLELPEDMLREKAKAVKLVAPAIAKPSPSAADMARVHEVLRSAKKPLMVIGGAAWDEQTSKLVEKFAKKHDLPVVTAFRRQDSIDNHSPNYIGELSVVAAKHVEQALQAADCLIILSARFGDITGGGYARLSVPYNDKKIIHVFPSADELQHVYYAHAPVISTPTAFMQALAKLKLPRFRQAKNLLALKDAYEQSVERATFTDGKKLSMAKVAQHLRNLLPPQTIITAGAGNYTSWGQRHYRYRYWRTELACTNGSMGYGVPAALAARVHDKLHGEHGGRTPIVCFAGDGCFMMTAQELATAVQYDLPIIILIVNNNSLATIRAHQEKYYPGRKIATDLKNPDFAAFAKSFGAFGATITRTQDFPQAFADAQMSGKPAVIDLQVDMDL